MKVFYSLMLGLVLAACGGEAKQAQTDVNGERYYFAEKYEFPDVKQAFYFERASRFRVLQQGLTGDFEHFLKGDTPNPERLAKIQANITDAAAYYADDAAADDPYPSCRAAASDAETLMKILVTSGGGAAEVDKLSYDAYRQSMQQCRTEIMAAETSLKRK